MIQAEYFLPKTTNKAKISTPTSTIQHHTENAIQCNETGKIKEIYIGKKKIKLCLFSDKIIFHTENPN